MEINHTIFNTDLMEILIELQNQLAANGISLLGHMRQTGHNVMVACPYHGNGQEKRPSAGIDMRDGTFHCFACGQVHTLPEVVSFCFSKDDILGQFGWEWLLKNFLTIQVESRKEIPLELSRNHNQTENRQYVSEAVLDSFRYTHPYHYKRKLTDEIIEKFDLGFDKETNCITFPVRDVSGNTLFVAKRSVQTKFFNYPMNAEKPVYGLYELSQLPKYPKEVIICESMIDCLTAWVYGKYAVALNGLGNELQFKQLNEMPCRKFILATDMDEAGRNARVRIRKNIKGKIVTEYIWLVNEAKDINDMSREMFDNLQEIF